MRPKSARRVAFQWLKKAGSESYFRNDPEKSEVRQLYYGKTPPTPKEIKRGPGGKQYSTLNRYLISPKPSSLKNASLQEHDLFKTLSNLAKNNEGRWKSQRQANFIISNMVDTKRFGASSHVESWLRSNRLLRPTARFGPKIAFSTLVSLNYARYDRSRIRYFGAIFVVDEGGISFFATTKVNHPRGGAISENDFKINLDEVKVKFKRPRGFRTSVVSNYRERQAERARNLKKQIGENQKLIQSIQGIPDWEKKDILVSFIEQLEMGRTLSPRQMAVLRNYIPVEIGNSVEWQETLDTFLKLVKKNLIPAMLLALDREIEIQGYHPSFDEDKREVRLAPSELKAGRASNNTFGTYFYTLLYNAKGKGKVRQPSVRGWVFPNFPYDMVQQVRKAIKAKNRATKKSLKYLTDMTAINGLINQSPESLSKLISV